ncbi:S8 family serine peptidase [Streptomyces qinglanensis]|uniref:Peptidase inhibitor I9 n=1 Tax=Streptomyces qinglanensis TaxID=943816 RepID=A0A1H9S545_9ACTN|nr:S8 family serine peptidase [Streptomyces qinglanensis]SER80176.1 Peptidase inhibitor I9 [Streptomyces qinglanensis]
MNSPARIPVLAALAAAVLTAVLAPPSQAAPLPPDGRIRTVADALPGRYIVALEETKAAAASVRDEAARIARAHGADIRHTYGTALHGYAAGMTAEQARRTAADPAVAYVEQDAEHHGSATQKDPPSWGLDRIDQRNLPLDRRYTYDTEATGVTVYLVDSGLRTTHAQFEGRASIGVDEVGDGRRGQDCLGHGTHVAGTVGGKDHGVAKGVRLVAARVLNCRDSASTSSIIAAADWITAHAAKPAVVNMSINGGASRSEDEAIEKSIASGVTWVVSSGNDNEDACGNSPGGVTDAIVVNNADSTDTRRSDSDYGRCTDLFAPGTSITSAWNTSDTATKSLSGTSMAAPHVTGAAARYLSGHPDASPADVQAALIGAATENKIKNAGSHTPNRLLCTDATGSGGGTVVFSDGFESDRGWRVDGAGSDTASSGVFERGVAEQTVSTYSNQVKQLAAVSGSYALTTGAAAGGAYGDNDLDGGRTTVFSPLIALPEGGSLSLRFSYNVAHGDNSDAEDYLRVRVLEGTSPTTVFERKGSASEVAGQWREGTVDLSAFAGKSVRVYLEAADAGSASLFEAQVDDLSITRN